jgi:hypothetical protein
MPAQYRQRVMQCLQFVLFHDPNVVELFQGFDQKTKLLLSSFLGLESCVIGFGNEIQNGTGEKHKLW